MKPVKNLGSLCGTGTYFEVTCQCCGKVFPLPCPSSQYRFKDRHSKKYYCGWNCKRKWEQAHPKKTCIYYDYLI